MEPWIALAFKIGSVVAVLAVTVYTSKSNSKTLNTKVLPELESMRLNLAAINLHMNGVTDLKKRFDEDHDKLVVVAERHDGLQKGVNIIRKEFKDHVTLYHTKN